MTARWLPALQAAAARPEVAAADPPALTGQLLPADVPNGGPDAVVALLVRLRAGDPAVAGLLARLGLTGGRSEAFLAAHRRRVDAGFVAYVPPSSWRVRAGLPPRPVQPPEFRPPGGGS